MKPTVTQAHDSCECEIRYCQFKNTSTPTPGLFCSKHDVFIDWLKDTKANKLIQLGVPVAPYTARKRSKNKNFKTKFYKQQRRQQINTKLKV